MHIQGIMRKATVHLIAIQSNTNVTTFIDDLTLLSTDKPPYLIKGRPCGWVQSPRSLHKSQLTGHNWDIFLLTTSDTLPAGIASSLASHISITIDIPQIQYDALLSQVDQYPQAAKDTHPLTDDWQPDDQHSRRGSKFYGRIPSHVVLDALDRKELPGELRLDHPMAWFLSSAEPAGIRGSPVCFLNLFKYKNGDKSTHDSYMQGFKEKMGPVTGAQVRFMGPVGSLRFEAQAAGSGETDGSGWDESNLTQYDSVWHYAYMLSTDVYKELNKVKVRGLEDTCILLVSELAL